MGDRKTFVLRDDAVRDRAARFIRLEADHESVVSIKPAAKSRPQEERYHAMIGDIAKQWQFCGRTWDAESMKRLLLDQFRRDTVGDAEFKSLWDEVGRVDMAPSIDGSGVVALGIQSRRFPRRLASAFIEWLFAFGAERDVQWTNERPQERVMEAA